MLLVGNRAPGLSYRLLALVRRRRWAAAFAASSVLGFLSQLTFVVYVLLSLLSWAALALLTALLAALGLLWLLDLRYLVVGGGPEVQTFGVLRELMRATLGLPPGLVELLSLFAVAAAVYEVFRLAREHRQEWVFFAGGIVAVALVALARPTFLAPRHFLLGVPFIFAPPGAGPGPPGPAREMGKGGLRRAAPRVRARDVHA